MNGRIVSESTREREAFKYDPFLLTDTIYNEDGRPWPNTQLRTSHDAVLTTIASLGASRLKTATCLISFFDQKWQYIVAEATPTLSLVPYLNHDERHGEQLWLCGTAIPRSGGFCERTLTSQDANDFEEVGDLTADLLPVSIVEDLGLDQRDGQKPYCLPGPAGSSARFCATVPIRSKRGINIGVCCVLDTVPRTDWDPSCTRVMRELSQTVMDYLELRRSKYEYRRSERMTRGLGSFVEGKGTTTVASWQPEPGATAGEGALNLTQQSMERQIDHEANHKSLATPDSPESPLERSAAPSEYMHTRRDAPVYTATFVRLPETVRRSSMTNPNDEQRTVKDIFSKAANIIRESLEVEGALFLDASTSSFGALNVPLTAHDLGDTGSGLSSPSDSDEGNNSSTEALHPCCNVLGFSTSQSSSLDGAENSTRHATVLEKLLLVLLRRYPKGKIFNFDASGTLELSDSSGSEPEHTSPLTILPQPSRRIRRNKSPWARDMEGITVSNIFPRARSVAFVPIWDAKKDRWYAGGFAFTNTPTRQFTLEGELGYLRAFGMLTMSEIFRLEATMAHNAQSDILSSLSHELRSPLHGVVLGVELLHETHLDVFQGDVLHTLETCGRTLLDTMDHLLDFAKINNYIASERRRKRGVRGLRPNKNASVEDGMKSLYSNIRLDRLVEEVIESVFAGFNFRHLSIAQIARRNAKDIDRISNQRLDSMQAMEELAPEQVQQLQLRNVAVYLDVDPNFRWIFSATPGAIRRILMNLFGNSLKYTYDGAIKVSLTQEVATRKFHGKHIVKIIVTDSGKGISQDFLRNELFKPFSQEDSLSPGAGLGLSLVKQIVSTLGGNISLQSVVGGGTTIAVTLPLQQVALSSFTTSLALPDEDLEFEAHIQYLKGYRIRLLGFEWPMGKGGKNDKQQQYDGSILMENICRDWLGLEVVSAGHSVEMSRDLVLCTETNMPDLSSLEPNHPPTVIVCANALIAYRLSTPERSEKPGLYQFVSQPIGPRTLAKVLVLACKRRQDPSVAPPTPPTPPTPPPAMSPSEAPAVSILEPSHTSSVTTRPKLTSTHWTAGSGSHLTRVTEEEHTAPVNEKTFLLVDDNPINLRILASYMKKIQRRYDTASNGQEAVELHRRDPSRYCCVFMDISMPVMDGFEATRQIRALEREQHLEPAAIFALSGLASADAQQEAFASGIDLFLSKPVRLKELGLILSTRGLLEI